MKIFFLHITIHTFFLIKNYILRKRNFKKKIINDGYSTTVMMN